MKCKIILVIVFMFMFICAPITASAIDATQELKEQYEQLFDSSGANNLWQMLPPESKDGFSQNNVSQIDPTQMLNISFGDFLKNIWSTITDSLTLPISIFTTTMGVVLLCAILNALKDGFSNSAFENVFSIVCVLCISGVIIAPISQIITSVAKIIEQVSNFLLSFIPVYVAIITASGKVATAITYNTFLFGAIQVVSRVAATVLVPLLAIYMGFCLIGSTTEQINIESIARGVKNTVIWCLGLLLTIFIGLLSIQSLVANSTDTVSLKATKFALSTFLPVVGGAISEALNTVGGCVDVIKSTVGSFGILAIVFAFLPSIIKILLLMLSLNISASVSDMLFAGKISTLLRSGSSVLSLILGILLVFAVLLIISITIMLTITH